MLTFLVVFVVSTLIPNTCTLSLPPSPVISLPSISTYPSLNSTTLLQTPWPNTPYTFTTSTYPLTISIASYGHDVNTFTPTKVRRAFTGIKDLIAAGHTLIDRIDPEINVYYRNVDFG